jgi:release factor glutamine methyltransferase
MVMLRDFVRSWAARLEAAGTDAPKLSAELLTAEALGLPREELLKKRILAPDAELPEKERRQAESFLLRREQGEPAAYILGRKEFYGRDFLVTRATLIPRPETELLIDEALRFIRELPAGCPPLLADLGTGTGCIAVTLALEARPRRALAVDLRPDALAVARENARRLAAPGLTFILADYTLPLFREAALDLFVSNPPYISAAEYAALGPEIRAFEPRTALTSGESGLEHLATLEKAARQTLKPGGLLLMEMGWQQGEALLALFRNSGRAWGELRIMRDLSGLDRVFSARKQCFNPQPAPSAG